MTTGYQFKFCILQKETPLPNPQTLTPIIAHDWSPCSGRVHIVRVNHLAEYTLESGFCRNRPQMTGKASIGEGQMVGLLQGVGEVVGGETDTVYWSLALLLFFFGRPLRTMSPIQAPIYRLSKEQCKMKYF